MTTPPTPPTPAGHWHYRFARSGWARSPVVRVLMFLLGVLLLLVGGLLGFVPLLPGFPLGIAGLVLLSLSSRRVSGWLKQIVSRLPQKLRERLAFLHHHHHHDVPHDAKGEREPSSPPS